MNKTESKNIVFTECVRIWLKEIHPDFTFGAIHGKKMKFIIKKIESVCKYKGLEGTDEQIIGSFQRMAQWIIKHDFYGTKDLSFIDSHFNEIVMEIQVGKKKSLTSYNSAQIFGKYGHLL